VWHVALDNDQVLEGHDEVNIFPTLAVANSSVKKLR
jgi:hypothetical protein